MWKKRGRGKEVKEDKVKKLKKITIVVVTLMYLLEFILTSLKLLFPGKRIKEKWAGKAVNAFTESFEMIYGAAEAYLDDVKQSTIG